VVWPFTCLYAVEVDASLDGSMDRCRLNAEPIKDPMDSVVVGKLLCFAIYAVNNFDTVVIARNRGQYEYGFQFGASL
jgi:hypothetical protein